jgi:acetyl-CoA carboxylase carboxyltransferase component
MAGEPVTGPREPSKLEAVRQARRAPLDEARPAAIARHKAKGRLTARENIADLLDAGSFVEYGLLARPAREGMEGAADGLVMGTGTVDGLAVVAVAYDYTVHAGTQSAVNHLKIDHMFDLAIRHRLPAICWLEGGGARPHDLNVGLRGATQTFVAFARLSGLAPTWASSRVARSPATPISPASATCSSRRPRPSSAWPARPSSRRRSGRSSRPRRSARPRCICAPA